MLIKMQRFQFLFAIAVIFAQNSSAYSKINCIGCFCNYGHVRYVPISIMRENATQTKSSTNFVFPPYLPPSHRPWASLAML